MDEIYDLEDSNRLINSRQLRQMIPVHPMTIHRWEKDPKVGFPKRIRLNNGHAFWRLGDVKAWIDRREKTW